MDENQQAPEQKSSGMKMVVPAVVIGLIVIAVVAFFALGMNQNNSGSSVQPSPQEAMQTTSAPAEGEAMSPITGTQGAATDSQYKDGEFEASGSYVTPGGPRDVDVTVTLKDGIITAATFTGTATDPNSKRFQMEFADNFEPLVVGKNIDEVALTKVAGSSLSPKGFMDALATIKTEAEA